MDIDSDICDFFNLCAFRKVITKKPRKTSSQVSRFTQRFVVSNLTIPTLVDVVSLVVGFYTAIVLLVERKQSYTVLIGLFLLFFSFGILNRILDLTGILADNPVLYFLPVFLSVLVPLLFYGEYSLHKKLGIRQDWLFFLPLGLEFLFCVSLLFMPVKTKETLHQSTAFHATYHGLVFIVNIIFVAMLYKRGNAKDSQNNWIQNRAFEKLEGSNVKIAMGFLALQFMRFSEMTFGKDFLLTELTVLQSVLVLGFILYCNLRFLRIPKLDKMLQPIGNQAFVPEAAGVVSTEEKKLMRAIDAHMKKNKLYLDSDVSLQSVATELKMTQRQLSQLINNHSGNNFNRFINAYRITEALEMLNDSEMDHYSVTGIGFEAGFNSKATFFAVFKEFTGMSPAEFRNQRKTSKT